MTEGDLEKRKTPTVWNALAMLSQAARVITPVVRLWWLLRYGE